MTRTIRLERRMTHDAATRLWDDVAAHKDGPLELDCSEVKHLSGSALQVLIAADRLCRRDGNPFTLTSASEAFTESLHLLGAEKLSSGEMA